LQSHARRKNAIRIGTRRQYTSLRGAREHG
jgi:hypothetical protein